MIWQDRQAAACRLAMAFDEGCVAIKIGREEPVASMDSSGKVIWARHNDIQTVNIKSLGPEQEVSPLLWQPDDASHTPG